MNNITQEFQRRYFREMPELLIEQKEEKSKNLISGYAATYNNFSRNLGGFKEIIQPNAFTNKCIEQDVLCLFNHQRENILGRKSNNTLHLEINDRGLHYENEIAETIMGKDVITLIKRKDITQSSFGFFIKESDFELLPEEERSVENNLFYIHKIHEVKRVIDVSPVCTAAYPQTSVDMRNHIPENLQKEVLEMISDIKKVPLRGLSQNYNILNLL